MTFVEERSVELTELVDRVIPRDEWPSASESGGLAFLGRILAERTDWIERVERLLAAPDPTAPDAPTAHADAPDATDPGATLADAPDAGTGTTLADDWAWFAELVNAGYYADEANGGNRDGASWTMLGWHPEPNAGWPVDVPVAAPTSRTLVGPADLSERYDAIVVGSGAGGGVAAALLAESGRRVLIVEAGDWPETAALASDHIRNPRSEWGVSVRSGFADDGHPRVLQNASGEHLLRSSDWGYSNNASTVGGGTRVYGAQAWRFAPLDFRMASTYGVPDGSDLADWPIGYEDLEPYYARAEWEVGVSGDAIDGTHSGHRSRAYPMPPLPGTFGSGLLREGAAKLGIETLAVPLLVNSRPYLGRLGCAQCAMCVGFACPVDAKNGSQNSMLPRAFATGRSQLIIGTMAERVTTDAAGRVNGVALVGESGEAGEPNATGTRHLWRREILADQVIVAGGAVESARLLLNSRSEREPNGLGNTTAQVGRRLQGHTYGGAIGIFDERVVDLVGPGPAIATTQFRHGNEGIVGGGMMADEFVTTPSNTYRYLVGSGLLPRWGAESKAGMRELAMRMMRVMGPIQEMTTADARVQVDPRVTDRYGIPVARLSGAPHEEDFRARDFLADRADEWLRASGATTVATLGRGRSTWAPSGGQHQAGTCRMGDDPARSVVDPEGRVWGHDNLRVTDGSVHVTNGGVNPVLTILANAFRTTDLLVSRGA